MSTYRYVESPEPDAPADASIFWRRLSALGYDALPFLALDAALASLDAFPAGVPAILCWILMTAVAAGFEGSPQSASPGKLLVGLVVRQHGGQEPLFGYALKRAVLRWVPILTGIGVLKVLLGRASQCPHDRWCHAKVELRHGPYPALESLMTWLGLPIALALVWLVLL